MILRYLLLASFAMSFSLPASAALTLGVVDDFEDGTLGGWETPVANTMNVAGGPAGSIRALQIAADSRLAAFDAGADIMGEIDPSVSAITVDMMRAVGTASLEFRLVLFGPGTGNRWTSTIAQVVPGDGVWTRYTFSILENDLTQAQGGGSYADLTANLDRIMFRYDDGAPSAQGTFAFGEAPIFIDNVTAIPEPTSLGMLSAALAALCFGGRRRPA